jgi:FMN phosphatase YigB (HAD superfamily)
MVPMTRAKVLLVDAVHTFVIPGEGVFVEMQRLLDSYPNEKVILTNANEEQMATFGLHGLPYTLFTLEHDPDKVDPRYFEIMLERFTLSAADVVYESLERKPRPLGRG